jgi:hypothetical protein
MNPYGSSQWRMRNKRGKNEKEMMKLKESIEVNK